MTSTSPPGWAVGLAAAAAGGALGTALRSALLQAWPQASIATVLVINVAGSAVLAALPLLAAVRRRPWLAVLLGTGVCGGFTTMSTASVDALGLLDDGRPLAGAGYVLGTLGGALLAVHLVARLVGDPRERGAADEGGDL